MKCVIKVLLVLMLLFSTDVIYAAENEEWIPVNFQRSQPTGQLLGTISPAYHIQYWRHSDGHWSNNALGLMFHDDDINILINEGLLDGSVFDKKIRMLPVKFPQEVTDFLNSGGKMEDVDVHFTMNQWHGNVFKEIPTYRFVTGLNEMQMEIYPYYKIKDKNPRYVFEGEGMNYRFPRIAEGFGYNVYSMYTKDTNQHLGMSRDIRPEDIINSQGHIDPSKDYEIILPNSETVLMNGSEIKIGNGTFNNGGAIGFEFLYGVMAHFYVKEDVNLRVSDIYYSPSTVISGEEVRTSVLIGNDHTEAVDSVLQLKVDGSVIEEWEFSIDGASEIRSPVFSLIAPEGDFEIEFEVNPSKAQPENERTWEDNIVKRLVPVSKPNLKASDIWYNPGEPKPGNTITTSVLVTNEYQLPITTDVILRVDGSDIETKQVTIPANGSVRTPGYSFIAPDKDQIVVQFEANPNRDKPTAEVTWEDNIVDRTIVLKNDVNLRILFRNEPKSVDPSTRVKFDVVVVNDSDKVITTDVVVRDDYKYSELVCVEVDEDGDCVRKEWVTFSKSVDDRRTVTIQPRSEVVYSLIMPTGWDYWDFSRGVAEYHLTLTGEVNPSKNRPTKETNWADNIAIKDIWVNVIEPPEYRLRLWE